MSRGALFVISGPSGSGKGTICKELLSQKEDCYLSISATSRQPRPGEEDGKNYFFMTKEAFAELRDEGGLLEWAEFCDNFYGTPRRQAMEAMEAGQDVILEIEVQGAMQVRKSYPEAVLIFVVPPSEAELRRRLTERGTEDADVIEKRLNTAKREYTYMEQYDYIVVNDTVEQAVARMQAIMLAERCKKYKNNALIKEFCKL